MPKKPANPTDLARDIRDTKLEAMREFNRFQDADELRQLRTDHQKLKNYCAKLEAILATAEGALIRMGTPPAKPKAKPAFPKFPKPYPPAHANGGVPKKTRPSPAPKQTALPGELGKVVPQ